MIAAGARRLAMCLAASLGAACGSADVDDPGGDAGGTPDAREWADAAPDAGCEPTPALPIAWSENFSQQGNRVAIDGDGSLVVAVVNDPLRCARLFRLASDGAEIWRHPYDPSPVPAENYKPCPSWWSAIALDPYGAIVTVSHDVRYPDTTGPTDILVRKHDRDGNALWTYYNQNAPDGFEGWDSAADVDVGRDGAVVAAGTHASRPWVGRFTPDGTAEWIRSSTGEAATQVEAAAGGITYAGITTGEIDGPRYRIARFDPDGSETTIAQLTNIPWGPRGVPLAATPDGGLVFVLQRTPPVLRKVDATGAVVWDQPMDVTAHYVGCQEIDLRRNLAIAVEPDGSIVALFGLAATGLVLARFSDQGELLSLHLHGEFFEHLAVGTGGVTALVDRRELIVTPPLEDAP